MGAESPSPVTTPAGAVFLSYASQDADAANRICEALRGGVSKVWLDQSELRGGDGWDRLDDGRCAPVPVALPGVIV